MRHQLSRRDWLRLAAFGVSGSTCSGWLNLLAEDAKTSGSTKQRRACIVLWMGGGPSQTDTFDLKPGHANGGPFREIDTSAAGVRISEHLPQLAKWGQRLAVVRSMTTKEGDHGRATQVMHTGYAPQGPIQFPQLGSLIAKELADLDADLPNCVSIAPSRNVESQLSGGFLGPNFTPLAIGAGDRAAVADIPRALQVPDLRPSSPLSPEQFDARLRMLAQLDGEFLANISGDDSSHPSAELARGHRAAYERAVRLMRTEAAQAFDLEQESSALRDAYGRNLFGQGCLLARRLIERDVPFVEVSLSNVGGDNNSWDTHQNNFERVQRLSEILDPAWSTLLRDLDERGRLDSTLVVWMGEFGRTPKINNNTGRDHFPNAWSAVLSGGGIRGGQVIGKTSDDAMRVTDRPVTCPDLFATICKAIGIDPRKQNLSNVGRPIRIADHTAKPIDEVLL